MNIGMWQAFSAALAITNIVGVPVGGFGVPFESLSDSKAIIFLKVRAAVVAVSRMPSCIDSKSPRTGTLRIAVLVHNRRGAGQALRALPVPAHLLHRPLPHLHKNHDGHHSLLARLLPLRHLFPSLAALVQLDRMRADDQLSGHVRAVQRDGYPAGHQHPVSSDVVYLASAHESEAESRDCVDFRVGHIVCFPSLINFIVFLLRIPAEMRIISCIVSSIARLVYAVGFVELNIKGNYAVNFDSIVPLPVDKVSAD